MAPVSRARTTAAAPPPVIGVNFGDDAFYAGGGMNIPEGDYALEFATLMHQPTKQDGTPSGQPRLAVQVVAHPLKGGEAQEAILGMGSKAHLSFQPDPNTGKGLVAVPGGPSVTANDKTNWNIFRKSLYDCGLPKGIFTNDLSVLDGIHVHLTNVPEPEERKGFNAQAATGEVHEEQKQQGPKLVCIVTEIKEDGKPWEGTGGIPAAGAPTPAAKAPVVKQGPKGIAPKVVTAPVVQADGEDVETAALNGIGAVLEANPNGCSRLLLRTQAFSSIKAAAGEEMAQAVTTSVFGSDEALGQMLGKLGYAIQGSGPAAKVVVAG